MNRFRESLGVVLVLIGATLYTVIEGKLGVKTAGAQLCILGGIEAKPVAWPWMASLYSHADKHITFIGGATIIHERYLLTAAHCVDNGTLKYVVKVGGHSLFEGQHYFVQAVHPHPVYHTNSNYHDIALLELSKELSFNRRVRSISLPSTPETNLEGKDVTIIGWGTLTSGGSHSHVLNEATLPVSSQESCNRSYTSLYVPPYPQGINSQFLCAGSRKGGIDSCQGDSGGPLMWNDGRKWSIEGIVSGGFGCGLPNFPGVYTRVSKYVPWIKSIVKDLI